MSIVLMVVVLFANAAEVNGAAPIKCEDVNVAQCGSCIQDGQCREGNGGGRCMKADWKECEDPCCCGDYVCEDPCFPGTALVTLSDGTASRVDALKEGDAILAATPDGSLTFDKVSIHFSIQKPKAHAEFLSLTTNGGRTLTVTAAHHLPTGEACCANLARAADLGIGDRVWIATEAGTEAHIISKLTHKIAKGLHSPVLVHGAFPIVDGVVTSFDREEVVAFVRYTKILAFCSATGILEFCSRVKELAAALSA